MRIRSKLLILMAIPALVVMLVAGLGLRSQAVASSETAAASVSVQQAAVIHSLLGAITTERLGHLGAADMAGAQELHGETDAALDVVAGFASNQGNDEIAVAVQTAREMIQQGRASVDGIAGLQPYSQAYVAIREIPRDFTDNLQTSETLSRSLATDLVVAGTEEQSAAWFQYLAATDPGEVALNEVSLAFALSHQSFAQSADLDPMAGGMNQTSMTSLRVLETIALDDLAEGQLSLSSEEILPALLTFTQDWSTVVADRDLAAIAVADDLADAASLRSTLLIAALLATLALGVAVFMIYRSIADPLANLVDRAHTVANDELPSLVDTLRDPDSVEDLPTPTLIEQNSEDELGELVEAFNGMQSTAYQLAIEQSIGKRNVADMFVNFGRRNQLLLQRMLTVITGLELDEEDPESLEGLFQLDNIVTRMRRNAESLLILAGAQTTRQWTAPVEITDTVRAAFGEVEAYERIDIVALTDVKIRGSAVSDISHLLAELLENALTFSEGTTPVLVSGQFDKTGYLITIFDQGIGMNLEELEEANQRISNPPALDRAPTRFLGLFVVGRLAERHGISARLVEAPGRGLMARVHLPREILATETATVEPEIAPIRSGVSDVSPLEAEQNIDAEWEGLAADGLPQRPVSSDDGGLPTREIAPGGPDVTNTVEALPTRSVAVAETSAVVAEPVAAAAVVAELPAVQVEPATQTEPLTEVQPVEDVTLEVAEADAGSEEIAGLPTRRRGENFAEEGAAEPMATAPVSEKPAGGATDFSSMMTALSSGISRGLEESTDESDNEWSGK